MSAAATLYVEPVAAGIATPVRSHWTAKLSGGSPLQLPGPHVIVWPRTAAAAKLRKAVVCRRLGLERTDVARIPSRQPALVDAQRLGGARRIDTLPAGAAGKTSRGERHRQRRSAVVGERPE